MSILNYKKLTVVLLCLVLVCTSLSVGSVRAASSESTELSKEQELLAQLERFFEIFVYLNEFHVDNPSAESLVDDAIEGMLFFMGDPYTTYMKQEEYEAFLGSVNGTFVGIGIYAGLTEEGVEIQGIIPNGPAAKAGLQVGDIIRQVNGGLIEGHSVEEATGVILGEEGTEVELTIERIVDGESQTLVYQLIREQIQLPHVEWELIDKETAHLKLYRFGTETYDIIKRELGRIKQRDVEKLILDLRGNSGGMMDSVVDIASLFKESGVIFHTRDNTGQVVSHELEHGSTWEMPMVVLIDYSTASAAEVLAGFLQDHGIALVVGEPSFGKGRIQTSIELEHGGILHISIEEYFTPNMKRVDKEGIIPDVYVFDPALQVAKAYGILLELDEIAVQKNGQVSFNGLTEDKYSEYVLQDGENWYLSARMLSDWYGGLIEWDYQHEVLILELFDNIYVLNKHHPQLKLHAGKAYLALDYVLEKMPLEIVEQEDGFTIMVDVQEQVVEHD